MTPVFQRIISETRGDCQSCCIASLLDLPYEQVPTWLADAYDRTSRNELRPDGSRWHLHHWFEEQTDWLRARGWHLARIPDNLLTDYRALVGAYCLASMPSQALPGHSHAVVGQWVKAEEFRHQLAIVHDPNPNNKPYPMSVEASAVSFLIPLNPAQMRLIS
jgi:hypothetical protein